MSQLKSNFAVKSKYEAFYIGGKVQLSNDGVYMFCCCGNKVNILEISTGQIHSSLGELEDEEITSFCLTPDNKFVVLATQPLLLRQWDWKEKKIIRTWKAIHFAPVVSMAFDRTSTLLATGSADSTVKVWDIDRKYCTHNLRGHQGIVSCVEFHPDTERLELYSSGEDYKVRVWDLKTSSCIAEVGAHFSSVTSILFSTDGNTAFTSGRDGVVIMWDTLQHKTTKTIPVYEKVESIVLLPEGRNYKELNVDGNSPHFITAGSKGVLKVWNAKTSRCIHVTSEVQTKTGNETGDAETVEATDSDDVQNISHMMYNSTLGMVAVITYDHNISFFTLEDLKLKTQFAGNNDEIVDLKYFGEDNEYVIVATNSKNLKVFRIDNWNCQIVYGHTDTVLSVDVEKHGKRFITAGKDTCVRLWEMTGEGVSCLGVGQGHTNPVAAVAFSKLKGNFCVSGSEDCTLKLWPLPKDLDPTSTTSIYPSLTERAHEKEINSVAISPNDKFIATGSMDKTAKLWNSKDLSLIGVMRGHKRGIWCVQFSPVDQILATCSSDNSVKLWSVTDFTCVRTFEGHDSSVLKVSFISRGMQLISGDSSGLVRLWTIKTNECEKVLEGHDDKIWALATNRAEDSFITGGVDSSVVVWEDVTEKEEVEKKEKQEKVLLQEQELSNLLQKKKYLKAIGLAIVLEQPFRILNILKEILSEYENGEEKLHETLQKMRTDQIDALLRFASKWNTNSRHCHAAQYVLSSILKIYPSDRLKKMGNIKSSVEGLLPYTERHFSRMSRLLEQSMFLEYTWQCMKGRSTEGQQTGNVNESDEEVEINTAQVHSHNKLENTTDSSEESSVEQDKSKDVEQENEDSSDSSSSESDFEVNVVRKQISEATADEIKQEVVTPQKGDDFTSSESEFSGSEDIDSTDENEKKTNEERKKKTVVKKQAMDMRQQKKGQEKKQATKQSGKRKMSIKELPSKKKQRQDKNSVNEVTMKTTRQQNITDTKRTRVKNGAKLRKTSRNR